MVARRSEAQGALASASAPKERFRRVRVGDFKKALEADDEVGVSIEPASSEPLDLIPTSMKNVVGSKVMAIVGTKKISNRRRRKLEMALYEAQQAAKGLGEDPKTRDLKAAQTAASKSLKAEISRLKKQRLRCAKKTQEGRESRKRISKQIRALTEEYKKVSGHLGGANDAGADMDADEDADEDADDAPGTMIEE